MQRADDFEQRREQVRSLSDAELHERFWRLLDQVVAPLVEEARTYTSPAIERSVLLRMGLSSVEAKAVVDRLEADGVLGRGAGRIVLEVAQQHDVDIRGAAAGLLDGRYGEAHR